MNGIHGFGKVRREYSESPATDCGRWGGEQPGLRLNGVAVLLAVLLAVCLVMARPVRAQVAPAGDAGGLKLWAGAAGSGYYLQYGERKLLGIAGFADADTKRRIGIEAEARWLVFHQTANVNTTTYAIGPRYHMDFGRFEPYAKGLAGMGEFNFPYNLAHGSYLVIAPGGGVDYRINHRIRLRAVDFEYQLWPQFTFGFLSSYGVSTGIRVRIF
jgi:hypothetical protein